MAISNVDAIQSRLFERPAPPLEPGKNIYDPSLTPQIKSLKEHRYVVAALHLANDDINNCHLIAQGDEGDPTADLLHATLHRREGDYWNSKYWWSRIGKHPLLPSTSAAKSFVDACEKQSGSGSKDEQSLRERQWDELKRLVSWTRENCH